MRLEEPLTLITFHVLRLMSGFPTGPAAPMQAAAGDVHWKKCFEFVDRMVAAVPEADRKVAVPTFRSRGCAPRPGGTPQHGLLNRTQAMLCRESVLHLAGASSDSRCLV